MCALPQPVCCVGRGPLGVGEKKGCWVSRRGVVTGSTGPSLQGEGGVLGGVGAGQATYKRFSSPRPRKAPGCTVLMTLFLRSLWEESGEALMPLPFCPNPPSLPWGLVASLSQQVPGLSFLLHPVTPQHCWGAG